MAVPTQIMDYRKKYCLLYFCLALLCLTQGVHKHHLSCYHCQNWANPSLCKHRETCHENQACIVTETVDENFQLKYNLGCVDKRFCSGLPLVGEQVSPAKRNLQFNCCSTDYCNNVYPSQLTRPPLTSTISMQPSTPPTTTTTTITTTTIQSIRCYSGWTLHDDKCFLLINHEVTWSEAEHWCVLNRGVLAGIHSNNDKSVIANLTNGEDAWIGGYFQKGSSALHWTNHHNANYTDWENGQPHHATPSNCVVFDGQTHQWKTDGCRGKNKFFCETTSFH